jgi:hypothetical protein
VDPFASIEGHRVNRLRLHVGNTGPWFAELDLDEALALSGQVEIRFGDLTLKGTVQPGAGGVFTLSARLRVVASAGGWGQVVSAKGYHNDAGVKAKTVAEDVAREVGETIGTWAPGSERLGHDYLRRVSAAATVLEDAAGGVPWWVDNEGNTNVAPRPAGEVAKVELLNYDPMTRFAEVSLDNPGDVVIGSMLEDERLEEAQTVREIEFRMESDSLRAFCWCGGGESSDARLPGLLKAIARRATDEKVFGKWRYRVVSMGPDGRVNLQVVRKASGLPSALLVPQWPGVAGAHAELTNGAEVLVEFIEGDVSSPIVSGYVGKGGTGFVPLSLSLLGGTRPIARVGDQVSMFMTPGVPVPVAGLIGVPPAITPFNGTATFPAPPLIGVIGTGNPKVLG